ncbi:MAG: DUF3551 domain-containing protein [Xanthobacteraceae bacterium]
MRFFAVAMTVLAALALGGSRAEARYGWHPWCAWLENDVAPGSCAYDSLRECWDTVRGVGGYCGINPYPPPPSRRYRARRHRGRYR